MNSLGAKLIPPAAAIMIYAPTLAQACAVCFDSEDDNRQAFIDTTIFLTVFLKNALRLAREWTLAVSHAEPSPTRV